MQKTEPKSEGDFRFCLDIAAINDLLDNRKLSKKTFSKMLQIISALIEGESESDVAKRFNVELEVVNDLRHYIM